MNLKESFRYQKFLDRMMSEACFSLQNRSHCLKTTETHFRSKSNTEADDFEKVIETEPFFANDDVLDFISWLIEEKERLTVAIGKAKTSIPFDIDAAVEVNKFRHQAGGTIKSILRGYVPSKKTVQGRDYKFNVEGNQTGYVYDIEVSEEDAYDRNRAKTLMREMVSGADTTSTNIDLAIINTCVEYEPMFDVNESFEDVMTEFLAKQSIS